MIAETIARLEANKTAAGLKLVDGAAQFQALVEERKNPASHPAAFVLPMGERPGSSQFSGNDLQLVQVSVAIVLVIRNVADATGKKALDDLQTVRNGVKLQLLGWVPLEGYDTVWRGRGDLLAFKDGHLWWQDVYHSSFYERKP